MIGFITLNILYHRGPRMKWSMTQHLRLRPAFERARGARRGAEALALRLQMQAALLAAAQWPCTSTLTRAPPHTHMTYTPLIHPTPRALQPGAGGLHPASSSDVPENAPSGVDVVRSSAASNLELVRPPVCGCVWLQRILRHAFCSSAHHSTRHA